MRAVRSSVFLLIISVMVLAPGVALLVFAFKLGSLGGLSAATLSGVTNPAPPPRFDRQSFFGGATQSAMEPWLTERMGRPREIYLRLKNGFDFVLGRSDAGISIGRSWFLNGKSYVDEWCQRRDRQVTEAAVAPVIAAVVAIDKALKVRAKPFVFLISPSKAAVLPEYLPSWCAPSNQPRPYDVLLAGLRSAKVPVVDGHYIALRAKATEQWPPFGRDGAHWNDVGQFYAARSLISELERQIGRPIGDLRLKDIMVDNNPRGAEADAGLIANLPFVLRPVSVHASFEVVNRLSAPTGLFVGTSFSWGPLEIMMGQKLFSRSKFYYYFNSSYRYDPGDLVGTAEGPIAESDLSQWLSGADFVVLEANEAELGAGHIAKFAAAVEALPKPY
jgi:alginate O-acetyltransferase complex protein AlgJ